MTKGKKRAAVVALSVGALVAAAWWVRESHHQTLSLREEAARLIDLLDLDHGAVVADIGAGQGLWTVYLARYVGDDGHVYATVGPTEPAGVFEEIARSQLSNVSVFVDSDEVPKDCCHAVLARRVFHHFDDPRRAAAKLFQGVQEGGHAVIIDFDKGTLSFEQDHGVARHDVEDAMARAGFELTRAIDDWAEDTYCLVFTRPNNEKT